MTRLKYLDPADGQYKLLPMGSGGGYDQAAMDARYVNVDGDTMTGNLVLQSQLWVQYASPRIYFDAQGDPASVYSNLAFKVNGTDRWNIRVSGAESGGNTGSPLIVIARDDTGASLFNFGFRRDRPALTLPGDPTQSLDAVTKQYVDKYSAFVKRDTDVTLTDNTAYQVVFESLASSYPPGVARYKTMTTTSAGVTVPEAGMYSVALRCGYGVPTAGWRAQTSITKNAGNFAHDLRATAGSNTNAVAISTMMDCAVNDVIGALHYIYGGSTMTLTFSYLTVVGPM